MLLTSPHCSAVPCDSVVEAMWFCCTHGLWYSITIRSRERGDISFSKPVLILFYFYILYDIDSTSKKSVVVYPGRLETWATWASTASMSLCKHSCIEFIAKRHACCTSSVGPRLETMDELSSIKMNQKIKFVD